MEKLSVICGSTSTHPCFERHRRVEHRRVDGRVFQVAEGILEKEGETQSSSPDGLPPITLCLQHHQLLDEVEVEGVARAQPIDMAAPAA